MHEVMSMGTQDEYVLMDLYANLSGDTFESVERSRVSKHKFVRRHLLSAVERVVCQ